MRSSHCPSESTPCSRMRFASAPAACRALCLEHQPEVCFAPDARGPKDERLGSHCQNERRKPVLVPLLTLRIPSTYIEAPLTQAEVRIFELKSCWRPSLLRRRDWLAQAWTLVHCRSQ